jgi:hypothetical protein
LFAHFQKVKALSESSKKIPVLAGTVAQLKEKQ